MYPSLTISSAKAARLVWVGRGPPRSAECRWDRRFFLVAVVVAVPVLAWAGIRLAGRDGQSSAFTVGDPGVSHVHGLGVNPADGTLYIATHHGTFRLGPDRKVERVGDSYQDTMGFTVAGPDRFLGSGHPDSEGFRRGQPPRLGLIESTNAGDTWRSVSLSGEVDFHGLAFVHDRVYGWDSGSGRFMVSSDSRTWETRSALPLTGFAVDPTDEAHIIGAPRDGLVESRDGGRTWATKAGPPLVVLSWDARAGLVGVTEDGDVHRSPDAGGTWSLAGQLPGSPQALLATADAWYAAAADQGGTTGIYRSSDAGRSWELYYREPPMIQVPLASPTGRSAFHRWLPGSPMPFLRFTVKSPPRACRILSPARAAGSSSRLLGGPDVRFET